MNLRPVLRRAIVIRLIRQPIAQLPESAHEQHANRDHCDPVVTINVRSSEPAARDAKRPQAIAAQM